MVNKVIQYSKPVFTPNLLSIKEKKVLGNTFIVIISTAGYT